MQVHKTFMQIHKTFMHVKILKGDFHINVSLWDIIYQVDYIQICFPWHDMEVT